MEDLALVQDADGNAAGATGLTESDEASDEAENAESDFKSYSVDNLLSLRESPFCRKWPEFLDESFKNSRGNWDPDRWHQNRKHGSTPPFDDKKQDRPGSSLSVEGKVTLVNLLFDFALVVILYFCMQFSGFCLMTPTLAVFIRFFKTGAVDVDE